MTPDYRYFKFYVVMSVWLLSILIWIIYQAADSVSQKLCQNSMLNMKRSQHLCMRRDAFTDPGSCLFNTIRQCVCTQLHGKIKKYLFSFDSIVLGNDMPERLCQRPHSRFVCQENVAEDCITLSRQLGKDLNWIFASGPWNSLHRIGCY